MTGIMKKGRDEEVERGVGSLQRWSAAFCTIILSINLHIHI